MDHGRRTDLTEAVRSTQLLRINGYCATSTMASSEYVKSRWNVDGHEWEVHLYLTHYGLGLRSKPRYVDWVALGLNLLGEPQRNKLRANLSCRLVDPSRNLDPSAEKSVSHIFGKSGSRCTTLLMITRDEVPTSGYLMNDSLTLQCTITVLKELPDVVIIPAVAEAPSPLPASDLHRHFGDLLQSRRGADVTFVLDSGERFPAHKNILAARSPVFMAEFFGHMNEMRSKSVQIQDMEAAVFKAMLHFIYTDMVPELEEEPEASPTMAQHLLAAADRYGFTFQD